MLIKLLILAVLSYNKYQNPLEIINQGINMQTPPIAKKIPYSFKIQDTEIEDEYHWLRGKGWPEKITDKDILNYLKEENDYFSHFMTPLSQQKDMIFEELKVESNLLINLLTLRKIIIITTGVLKKIRIILYTAENVILYKILRRFSLMSIN
jgi:hypothetical protein